MVIGVGLYWGQTFSGRDRCLLNLLRPHLVQTHARITAQTRVVEALSRARRVIEALEQGIIVLSRDRSVCDMTPRARMLLTVYRGTSREGAGRLPTTLNDWVNRERGYSLLEHDGPPAPPGASR